MSLRRLTAPGRADDDFLGAVAARREAIRAADGDVLVLTGAPVAVAAITCAAWSLGRRVVFAPTSQPSTVELLRRDRNLVVLDAAPSPMSGVAEAPSFVWPPEEAVVAEFHTSGSTGAPVAVSKRARQIVGEARFLVERFGIGPHDVLMSGVPAHHLYGFLFSVMIPLVAGCEVVDATPLQPEAIARIGAEAGVTLFVSTPTQLRAVGSSRTVPAVGRIFSSGAPLSGSVRRRLESAGLEVVEIFGSTETGGIAWRADADLWTPFEVVDVQEQGGVMHVRSPFLESQDDFVATSDMIERVGERFRHLGRADDVVKIGGKRVSKRTVEARLLELDEVQGAAVVDWSPDERPRRLYAFITSDDGVTAATLRQRLADWLDPVTIPRFLFVDELPRTALGKVSREAVQQLLAALDEELGFCVPKRTGESAWQIEVHVPVDSRYFDGHFDGLPILPGVVQLNAIVERSITSVWPELREVVRALRIKFHAPIHPGANLTLDLRRSERTVTFSLCEGGDARCSGQFQYR